jgi:hypothetical protein
MRIGQLYDIRDAKGRYTDSAGAAPSLAPITFR